VWYWKESFLLKKKPRYYQREFCFLCRSGEMKDFKFFMFDYKIELVEERGDNTITTIKDCIWFLHNSSSKKQKVHYQQKKERIEKFFVLFLKIWKRKAMYKAERIGKRTDSCPTLTSALNNGDIKWFHIYWVCLLIKLLEKKLEILISKLALVRIIGRSWWLRKRKNWAILKANVLVWRPLI